MHIPGVKHLATDYLSRYPISDPVKLILPDDVATVASGFSDMSTLRIFDDNPHTDPEEIVISAAISTLNVLSSQAITWDRICTATASAPDMLTWHA